MKRQMTKAQAEEDFFNLYGNEISKTDVVKNKMMWNDYTDNLQRDGILTDWQCQNWLYPRKKARLFLYSYERRRRK